MWVPSLRKKTGRFHVYKAMLHSMREECVDPAIITIEGYEYLCTGMWSSCLFGLLLYFTFLPFEKFGNVKTKNHFPDSL